MHAMRNFLAAMAVGALPALAGTWVVTHNGDSGPGSFRQAVADAVEGDAILFELPLGMETVTVTQDVVIAKGLFIDGANAAGSGVRVTLGVPVPGPGGTVSRVLRFDHAGQTSTVQNVTLRGGDISSREQYGGAIHNVRGTLNVRTATVAGAQAALGGGIMNDGTLTIAYSTIVSNRAQIPFSPQFGLGGGVMNRGRLTVLNSTFEGNLSSRDGGGVCSVLSTNPVLVAVNSTFVRNRSAGGLAGGVYHSRGRAIFLNSIVVSNVSITESKDLYVESDATCSAYYSWIGSYAGTIATQELAPATLIMGGPVGPLANNGGPTPTILPGPASPAQGRGAFAYYGEEQGFYFMDLDGNARLLEDWDEQPTVNPDELVLHDQRGIERRAPTDVGAFGRPVAHLESSTSAVRWNGGVEVTLTGENFSFGGDVAAVRLGGIAATVVSASATQVVAVAGAGPRWGAMGNVAILSTNFGWSVFSNAFEYNPSAELSTWVEEPDAWRLASVMDADLARYVPGPLHYALGRFWTFGNRTFSWSGDRRAPWLDGGSRPEIISNYGFAETEGKIWIVGGYGRSYSEKVWSYDGTTWRAAADLPMQMTRPAVGAVGPILYSVGGRFAERSRTNAWSYYVNSVTSRWEAMPGLPNERVLDEAAAIGFEGRLFVIGGYAERASQSTVFVFDPASNAWSEVAGLPQPRTSAKAFVVDDALYVAGGRGPAAGYEWDVEATNAWRWDGDEWTEVPGLLDPEGEVAANSDAWVMLLGNRGTIEVECWRRPGWVGTPGIAPVRSALTGGVTVVLSGSYLADETNPSDVSVSFCGVPATILSHSATQIVAVTAPRGEAIVGDVAIDSVRYGPSVFENAFEYLGPKLVVKGTNNAALASGESASAAKGTAFGRSPPGRTLRRTYVLENTGNDRLMIGGISTGGTHAAQFRVVGAPAVVPQGASRRLTVEFLAQEADCAAQLVIDHNAGGGPFAINLEAGTWPVVIDPPEGELAGMYEMDITFTNGVAISNGEEGDVRVWVGTNEALTDLSFDTDYVIFEMPAGDPGQTTVDVTIVSLSMGTTVIQNAFTYWPAPKIEHWTEDTNAWQEVEAQPPFGSWFGAVGGMGEQLVLAGGRDDGRQGTTNAATWSGHRAAPWARMDGLPSARQAAASVVWHDELYAIGGLGSTGESFTNVYVYSGTEWREAQGLPAARAFAGAGASAAGIGLAGGEVHGVPHTNADLYDG